MKQSPFRISVLFIFLLTIASCSKDDDSNQNPDQPASQTGKMNATVGSNEFSSDNATARFRSTGEFTMTATTADGKSLFFVIKSFSGAIDYTFAPGLNNEAKYSYQFNGSAQHFSTDDGGSGLFSVTDYNETTQVVSGTFSLVILQAGNSGNSIQITEGSFTNVPIKKLEKPAAGSIAYYADDSYSSSFGPDLEISPLLRIQFALDAPNGTIIVVLNSNTPTFSVDKAVIGLGSNRNEHVEISDYVLADGKLSVKLKVLEQRDFVIWINEYPIPQPYQVEDSGILYFYTDTADFISTDITVLDYYTDAESYSYHLSLISQNSNGSGISSSWIDNKLGSNLFLSLSGGGGAPLTGDSRLIFNVPDGVVSYVGFVAEDSSLVVIGKNIPY